MVKAKIIQTFTCKGRTYTPGMIVRFPVDDTETLTGYVEILPDQGLTRFEQSLQNRSSEWRQYCDHHERTMPGSICPLKRTRVYNPFRHCEGWAIKNRRLLQ